MRQRDMTSEEIAQASGVNQDGTCKTCGQKVVWVELDCRGARERGEPMPEQQVCRCIHPGDLSCACGNPCWSIF